MLAHFLGVLGLIGAALLVLVGLGLAVFGMARGDRRLASRAAVATVGLGALYLAGLAVSSAVAPTRALPPGSELSFCGLDCHLHLSITESDFEEDRIGIVVRARSDAKQSAEHPGRLLYRLVGRDGTTLVPAQEGSLFATPVAAGQSVLDTLTFVAPPAAAPYSLRITHPGPLDALLLGPAGSRAAGKTTLAIE